MKKIVFGIFAHPDDEAFGPSASLYAAAQAGTDVHLLLVTDGEQGANPDRAANLGAVRLKEWRKSGELIGATSQKALHYPDGKLCTDNYLAIASKIIQHIQNILESYRQPIQVDFVTFDYQGISGHLDHIAVSMITTYVYVELKKTAKQKITFNHLKYYCLSETVAPEANTTWVYMPAGKQHCHIDETFDFHHTADKKLEIMRSHHSQRTDCDNIIAA